MSGKVHLSVACLITHFMVGRFWKVPCCVWCYLRYLWCWRRAMRTTATLYGLHWSELLCHPHFWCATCAVPFPAYSVHSTVELNLLS